MFLSKVTLNPRHRATWNLLDQPYELHRTVARAFSEDTEAYRAARPLYRVDTLPEKPPLILVQSRLPADWSRPRFAAGQLLDEPESKEVHLAFAEGKILAFRLRANPCRTIKGEQRGERVPLWEKKPEGETPDERDARMNRIEQSWEAWMRRKAESSGFQVVSLRVTPEGASKMGNIASNITLNAVLYEGVLQVRNPEVFREALEAGIGPGKGFGFGLLSLART